MNRIFFYPHHSGVVCSKSKAELPVVSFSPQLDGSLSNLKSNIHVCTPNPGNLIHSESPARVFKCNINQSNKGNLSAVIKQFNSVPEAAIFFNNNYDCLVLSFANDIRVNWQTDDHRRFSELIKLLEIKVFIFGLGMQEPIDGGLEMLEPNIIELLNTLNSKAEFIGVRGYETEKWLNENKINNAIALGCPSMYREPKNILKAIKKSRGLMPKRVISAGYAHSKPRHKLLYDFLSRSTYERADYIFQNDLFAVFNDVVLYDKSGFYNSAVQEVDFSIVKSRLDKLHQNIQPFSKYYFFTNSNSWFQCNSFYDIFIGDRLHAAIASLLSGTPAILTFSDIRVKEIADFYGIPNCNVEELASHNLKSIVEKYFSIEKLDNFRIKYIENLESFHKICSEKNLKFIEDNTINEIIENTKSD